jgi:predicted outer membrane repeat protein
MRTHLLATTGVAALLAAMPAHAQTMTGGVAKRRLGAATPRRLAAVLLLAALGPAWPLPVGAQTLTTGATAVTVASTTLTTAIQTFAASPTAANEAAVTSALNAYNAAVNTAATFLGNVAPPLTTSIFGTVPANNALLIFSNGGSVNFPLRVQNNGRFFLGPGATNLSSMGPSLPASFTFSNLSNLGVQGGAILNSGTATITNSSFTGNSATGGGAITNSSVGILTIINSSFENNTSPTAGGAIRNESGGTLTIANSSFVGNSTTAGGGAGGAILNFGGAATITNSIFANNCFLPRD